MGVDHTLEELMGQLGEYLSIGISKVCLLNKQNADNNGFYVHWK